MRCNEIMQNKLYAGKLLTNIISLIQYSAQFVVASELKRFQDKPKLPTDFLFHLLFCRFLRSPAAEEACKYLNDLLHIKNLLLLRELNLSECELGLSGLKKLAALLQDKHCKLNTLM